MLSGKQECESKLGNSAGVGKRRVVVGRRAPLSQVQTLRPSNQEVLG